MNWGLKDESDVISETATLRVMNILLQGEQCVCNLVAILVLSQSVITHHLDILKNARMLSARKSGLWVYYKPVIDEDTRERILAQIARTGDPVFEQDRERMKKSSLCLPED